MLLIIVGYQISHWFTNYSGDSLSQISGLVLLLEWQKIWWGKALLGLHLF